VCVREKDRDRNLKGREKKEARKKLGTNFWPTCIAVSSITTIAQHHVIGTNQSIDAISPCGDTHYGSEEGRERELHDHHSFGGWATVAYSGFRNVGLHFHLLPRPFSGLQRQNPAAKRISLHLTQSKITLLCNRKTNVNRIGLVSKMVVYYFHTLSV